VPLQVSDADVDAVVERSDGVTASFLKELLRRAVLEALRDDGELVSVTGQHLVRALEDLLDSTQSVTRTLLGVGVDPADLPADGPAPMPAGAGWVSYRGAHRVPRHR
jgi:hypothetical protein